MVVRVDEARHHRQVRQIDDLRAGGNRGVRSDVANPRSLDDDDLIREDAAGVGIEQPSGADDGDRRRSLRLQSDARDEHRG